MNARKPSGEFGTSLIDTLGRIMVINLAHRTDRRREIDLELQRLHLGLTSPGVHLFAAIRPDDRGEFQHIGVRGCFLSHLAVLKTAQDRNWDRVLLIEDDAEFMPDILIRMERIMAALATQDWHILHGGTDGPRAGVIVDPASGLKRLLPSEPLLLSHVVAFRGAAIDKAVTFLEQILTRPAGHPDGGPMDVDGAYNHLRADHPDLITLLAEPPLARQRSSPPDVRPRKWFDRIGALRAVVRLARKTRKRIRA